jgi:hypothetical protein
MGFLKALPRLARGLLAGIIFLLLLLLVAAGALTYLALSGQDITALRAVARGAGKLLAGQRTDGMTLTVRAVPEQAALNATAKLSMRSLEDGRRRFYFLLNEGLRVRQLRAASPGGVIEARAYRLGPLLAVDLGAAIGPDQTLDITIDYEGAPGPGLLGANFIFEPGLIRLPVDSFWYPSDVQSFFAADVSVTAPRRLTVVHNGEAPSASERGALRTTRWTTARPIGALALVAGPYEATTLEADGVRYRLYTTPEERLDPAKIIAQMAEADGILRSKLGPHGFPQVTAFITDRLRRAFNDGSGVLALSSRYFRQGDYGFGLVAHELAHNWWGATVAEQWLSPGTGGEWLVEGFAEFSSIVASEAKYGAAAATLRLNDDFFDPAKQRAIAEMSVLDNFVSEAISRDTIYRKGAYVAFMLRQIIGEQKYFEALSQFLERFRYRQAAEGDMQKFLEEATGLDLAAYFEDWVRSDRLADLAVDKSKDGELEIANLGTARITGDITLWKMRRGETLPEAMRVRVGDKLPADHAVDHVILDPLLEWADVERENNRFPRRDNPVAVGVSSSGRALTTFGAPFAWVRATTRETASTGGGNMWEFTRGLASAPAFARSGETAVAAQAEPGALNTIVTLEADGSRKILGEGVTPAVTPEGEVYAAAGDRLLKWSTDGVSTEVLRRAGFRLERPLPSNDGHRVAYIARRDNDLDIRVYDLESGADSSLLSWNGDRVLHSWSNDDDHLYVALGVAWDWQVWSVAVGEPGGAEILVAGAAAIGTMALSPDGERLAFTAVPALEYPLNRHRLYVQPIRGGMVQTFELDGYDAGAVAWVGNDDVLVVTRAMSGDNPWFLPALRKVQRAQLGDGTVVDVAD